jgi:hypothetical protein
VNIGRFLHTFGARHAFKKPRNRTILDENPRSNLLGGMQMKNEEARTSSFSASR